MVYLINMCVMIAKFNRIQAVQSDSACNSNYGVHKLSKAVKMLSHETNLMVRISRPDGRKYLKKVSDVGVLLQAERFAKIYGAPYLNATMCQPVRSSSLQQQLDAADDDARFAAISSKYVQRPSEIAEESAYMNGIADSLKADVKSRVDAALAAAAERAAQQKPTAPAGDGAAASSSSE